MKIFDFFILLGTILPLQAQLELTAVELPKKLEETSGLEYLGTHFITHNDSGDEPKLYEFSKEGTLLKSTHLYTINAIDWEDITRDENYFYIADTGNNFGNRKDLTIYVVDSHFTPVDSIFISYAAQTDFHLQNHHAFDAEALAVVCDSLLLFSKNREDLSTQLYSIPKKGGSYTLAPRAQWEVGSLITAADYHADLDLLALTGYGFEGAQFFYTVTDFMKNPWNQPDLKKYTIPIDKAQIEAVKVVDAQNFWITTEKRGGEKAKLIALKLLLESD